MTGQQQELGAFGATDASTISLSVEGLTKIFGGLTAVRDLSFDLHRGEILGLIGPNGAGKTTTQSLISGFIRPDRGSIRFRGQELNGLPAHRIAAKGLVRTFQIASFFQNLTVYQHVFLACLGVQRPSPVGLFFQSSRADGKVREAERTARELLELMDLAPYADALPGTLPLGHKRWLSLATAMGGAPVALLLDEPLSGMRADEINRTLEILRALRERSLSILLIEHNMRAVMQICDRIVVLNHGTKICEGSPEFVRHQPEVIEAYLGRQT